MRIPHNALIIASGTIAAVTLVVGTVAAATDVFNDVDENFWAREYIEWANDNHIMTGPGGQDRVFQPNKPVTRAELAAVSFRTYVRLQQDIDMLSRRIKELENIIENDMMMDDDDDDDDAGQGSTSSAMSSAISVSSPSGGASAILPFPTDRAGRILLTAGLTGSDHVPSVATSGRGTANLRWTSDGLCYDISTSGLSGPVTSANFHMGARGNTGAVLAPITFTSDSRAMGCWPNLTSEQWRAILDGNVYIDVNTARHPHGEIRGQIYFRR